MHKALIRTTLHTPWFDEVLRFFKGGPVSACLCVRFRMSTYMLNAVRGLSICLLLWVATREVRLPEPRQVKVSSTRHISRTALSLSPFFSLSLALSLLLLRLSLVLSLFRLSLSLSLACPLSFSLSCSSVLARLGAISVLYHPPTRRVQS